MKIQTTHIKPEDMSYEELRELLEDELRFKGKYIACPMTGQIVDNTEDNFIDIERTFLIE